MRRKLSDMQRVPTNNTRVTCVRCGRSVRVPLFPFRCVCGLQTNEDGSTVSLRNHQLGDRIEIAIDRTMTRLGLRKPRGCGCEGRKQWLNRVARKARKAAWTIASHLHPR
jgi:hypothetical protein